MKIHELPFGKFIELNDAFVEVIIYEGIELTAEMIEQFRHFLPKRDSGSIGLLINKVNDYTFTFDAQRRLSEILQVDAVAIVTYSQISRHITESILNLHRQATWNIRIFDNRRTAIGWLNQQMERSDLSAARSSS